MSVVELTRLSLARAAEMIGRRELSPLELTEACLEHIDRVDPTLNAFITVTGQEAREEARQAAEEIAGGTYRGPLHGIPVALKDLFATRAVRTTAGSRIMAGQTPREDAEAVARLRAAGVVVLGKLNLHEFAFGATGVNPHYGATRNPWDTSRIAGGSSSGSAAAVASGECFAALGTDTGGSIRIPAALCGVVGLKPTYGRVSLRGVVPLSPSLDHVGPLTRTVEDAAILLGAIAGRDPLDDSTSDDPTPDYRRELGQERGLKGWRVGVPRQHFFEDVDGEVLAAVEEAVGVLSDLGAEVREVSLPYIAETPAAARDIMLSEAFAYHQRWLEERPQDYGDDVRHRLEQGRRAPAGPYEEAQRLRSRIARAWRAGPFREIDLLATPATAIPAAPVAESDLRTTIALIRLTNPFNLAGLPAISVPCGFTAAGLPVGLQLAGRWFEEGSVLRAAHAYEQATGWHRHQPPAVMSGPPQPP
jgi:aspartyl-tRNA(Asn)/glutamyl-tRNA(Gln) amidotransferase subunit A